MITRTTILPRRRPRRPSRTERVVGAGLLLLLLGLGALFAWAGTRPGPPGLPEPAAVVAGPLARQSPAGWPRGSIERYPVDELYEKIDGKADAYVALDVVELTFASYTNPVVPTQFVDVYVYDMARALNAFGIFRDQRSPEEASVPLGEEGAALGAAVFARRGRHYVEVVGSDPSAAAEARALASAVCAALPAADGPVTEPTFFPAHGRRAVRYALRNALGMESLGDAFLAFYDDGVQVVVARLASAPAAEAAVREARENMAFLGTPALFEAQQTRVVGVVGEAAAERRRALLDAVLAAGRDAR